MHTIRIINDELLARIYIPKELMNVLDKVLLHKSEVKYELNDMDEEKVELKLREIPYLPINSLHLLTFCDKNNTILDIIVEKTVLSPLLYSDDRIILLVAENGKLFVKAISNLDLLVDLEYHNKIYYTFENIYKKDNHIGFHIKEINESQYINIVIIAEQKESGVKHIVPITFQDGALFIPEKYASGIFHLHFLTIINSTIFHCVSSISNQEQLFHSLGYTKKTAVYLDDLKYKVVNSSESSNLMIKFQSDMAEINESFMLTNYNIINGEICYSESAIIFKGIKLEDGLQRLLNLHLVLFSEKTAIIIEITQAYLYSAIMNYEGLLNRCNFTDDLINESKVMNIANISINEKTISFELNDVEPNNLKVPNLCLCDRKTKDIFIIKGKKHQENYYFNFELFFENILSSGRWDIYLAAQEFNKTGANVYRIGYFNEELKEKPKRFFDLFDQQYENNSTYNERSRIYLTKDQKLSLVRNNISNLIKEQFEINTSIVKFSMKRNMVRIQIEVKTPYVNDLNVGNVYLIQRNKDTLEPKAYPVTDISYGKGLLTIHSTIDLLKYELFPLYWDVYLGVLVGEKEYYIRVSNVSKQIAERINSTISRYQLNLKTSEIIYPYITLTGDLSFTYRKREYFENRYYLFKENLAYYFYLLFKKYFDKKDIWIGYEKLSMSAHDSGYYFFDYVYKEQKHKNYYYIIRKDSPEIKNLENKKDKILYFMSFKYFVYMFASKLLISSDTKRNSYNLSLKKSKLAKDLTNKKLVYLQHGVNGLKVVRDFYKDRGVFDLVIAPSEYERKMILDYWGYKESEVVTTGLARWDALEDRTNEINYKQIFVMPTWRTWMDGMTKDAFLQSDYYQKYNEFLSSPRLDKILRENNVRIKFFLHPKFRDYIDLFNFDSDHIEKFGFLEVPLDEMIMKSSLMISDYSSVIWEMFYLGKPCVFYHFDKEKYLKYEGSYMDLDNDLFGDVAYNAETLVDIIESYINGNFNEKEKYSELRNKYLTYIDKNNSERIFNAIIQKKDMLYKDNKKTTWKITHIIPFGIRRKMLKIRDVLFDK